MISRFSSLVKCSYAMVCWYMCLILFFCLVRYLFIIFVDVNCLSCLGVNFCLICMARSCFEYMFLFCFLMSDLGILIL